MENQSVTSNDPTENLPSVARIEEAALWLSEHHEECIGRAIPELKKRFHLRNLDAIEAAKRAHALQYGRAL